MRHHHSMHAAVAVVLVLLTVTALLSACRSKIPSGGVGKDSGNESGNGIYTLDPNVPLDEITLDEYTEREFEIVIVPSPSLGSTDEIEDFGVVVGDKIVASEGHFGGGVAFDGLTASGTPLWLSLAAEHASIGAGNPIPEGFPTVVVGKDETLSFVNRVEGGEITEVSYQHYKTAEDAGDELPSKQGVYLCRVTVTVPRPSNVVVPPEVGEKFGDWYYDIVVVVEEDRETSAADGNDPVETPDDGIETDISDTEEEITMDFDDDPGITGEQ